MQNFPFNKYKHKYTNLLCITPPVPTSFFIHKISTTTTILTYSYKLHSLRKKIRCTHPHTYLFLYSRKPLTLSAILLFGTFSYITIYTKVEYKEKEKRLVATTKKICHLNKSLTRNVMKGNAHLRIKIPDLHSFLIIQFYKFIYIFCCCYFYLFLQV